MLINKGVSAGEVITLKLTSGEEIVAKLVEDGAVYYKLKNPQVIAQLEVQEETESLTDKISDLKNDQKRVNEYKSNLSNTNYYLEKLDNAIKTYRPSYIDKSIDSKLKALTNYFNTRLDEDGKFTSSGQIYESGKGWIDEPVPKGKQLSPHKNLSKPSWFSNMQDYYRKVVRFEKDFLAPRGIKPGAEAGVNLLLDIDFQIKATEEEIKQLTSEEALAKRVREIEIKREELQVREKSMSELILEFERLNYLLDDVKLPDVNKSVALSCPPLDANGVPRIDPEGLDLLNDCIKQQAQTKYIHSKEIKNEDGTTGYIYSPEREKLHKEIIKELTSNAVCIEQDKPIAVIMGGAPGSGKSTFLKTNAPYMQSDMIWKVDADEVRSFLPEYKGWNSSATHEETRDIVKNMMNFLAYADNKELIEIAEIIKLDFFSCKEIANLLISHNLIEIVPERK